MQVASACLTAFATASLTTKCTVVATGSGSGSGQTSMSTTTGTVLRQPGERGRQPVVEATGTQPASDLPQLGHGGAEFGHGLVQEAAHVDRAVVQVPLRQPDRHPQRHQPLLGAVVQIAFQLPSLLVSGLDESCPARLDVAQGAGELQPQPDDLDQGRRPQCDAAQEVRRGNAVAG
jgi:hypothetical protein